MPHDRSCRSRSLRIVVCIGLWTGFACAQFTTHLSDSTNRAFEIYVQKVEAELSQRWSRRRAYLWIRERPSDLATLQKGELVVQTMADEGGVPVSSGLIHDWVGVVLLPHAKVPAVVASLQDFDSHSRYYPEVIRSKTLGRSGNTVRGYWRLRQNQVVTVVLDVEQTAEYARTDPDRWHCKAFTTNISEVEDPGASHEKILPPGYGHGYLWRLNAYWSLEQTPQGVYAECRTVSLSRDVPGALRWAIKPILQTFPRESLASTLKGLRRAVSENAGKPVASP